MTREQIEAFIAESYPDDEIVLFDDCDEAFIGVGFQQYRGPVAVYDREKCVLAYAELFKEGCGDDGSDPALDAEEWVAFNTEGAWVGEATPILVNVPPAGCLP